MTISPLNHIAGKFDLLKLLSYSVEHFQWWRSIGRAKKVNVVLLLSMLRR